MNKQIYRILLILGCIIFLRDAVRVGSCLEVNKQRDNMEFDLLRAINVPLDEGITLEIGLNGSTAYGIKSYADIQIPRRMVLPKKLKEFCVLITMRLDSRMGGYIFSIVNALNTIIQLGVYSTSVINDTWNITLMHSDYNKHTSSQSIASARLPFDREWIEIAIKVLREEISIYQNGVQKGYFLVKGNPSDLVFDLDSTLYLGQAGPILKGNFEGTIQCLKIVSNIDIIPSSCSDVTLISRSAMEKMDSNISFYKGSGLNLYGMGLGSSGYDEFDFISQKDAYTKGTDEDLMLLGSIHEVWGSEKHPKKIYRQ